MSYEVSRAQRQRHGRAVPASSFTWGTTGTAKTPLDFRVLDDIERVDELERINWHNMGVGDDSVALLAKSLCENTTVQELILDGCKVTSFEAITHLLESDNAVTSLSLRGNKLGADGSGALFDAVAVRNRLTHLDVSQTCIGGFAQGQRLEAHAWDPAIAQIAQCLRGGLSLVSLNLSGNSIGMEGIRALVKADAFGENCRLRTLGFGGNLVGSRTETESGMELMSRAIRSNKTLESLDLSGNSIGIEGGEHIASILDGSGPPLTSLDLSKNTLGDEGLGDLAHALAASETLRTVNLRHNLVCDSGIAALAEAVKSCRACGITDLDLAGNSLEDAGANWVAHLIKAEHIALESLDLSANSIGGGEGLYQLAEGLLKDTSLVTLKLSGCSLVEDDGELIAEVLKHNKVLAHLDVSNNAIGEPGAAAFGMALPSNTRLQSLGLACASLGPSGTAALAAGLRGNQGSGLQVLELDSNDMEDEGADMLKRALKDDRDVANLTQLTLTRNGISSELLDVIRAQLEDRMDHLGLLPDPDDEDDGGEAKQ
eukprot:g444.t1